MTSNFIGGIVKFERLRCEGNKSHRLNLINVIRCKSELLEGLSPLLSYPYWCTRIKVELGKFNFVGMFISLLTHYSPNTVTEKHITHLQKIIKSLSLTKSHVEQN